MDSENYGIFDHQWQNIHTWNDTFTTHTFKQWNSGTLPKGLMRKKTIGKICIDKMEIKLNM